jgi:hypothetical protein
LLALVQEHSEPGKPVFVIFSVWLTLRSEKHPRLYHQGLCQKNESFFGNPLAPMFNIVYMTGTDVRCFRQVLLAVAGAFAKGAKVCCKGPFQISEFTCHDKPVSSGQRAGVATGFQRQKSIANSVGTE